MGESTVQRGDYSYFYWTISLKAAKKVSLQNSHHEKKIVTMYGDGCLNLVYIHHHIVVYPYIIFSIYTNIKKKLDRSSSLFPSTLTERKDQSRRFDTYLAPSELSI